MAGQGRWISLILPLALAACDAPRDPPRDPPKPSPSATPSWGAQDAVPAEFLGNWRRTGQECEPDSGEKPAPHLAFAEISFAPDFTYWMTVDYFRFHGRFKVIRTIGQVTISLEDSLHEFELIGDQLENWSEGEAVLLCGNIFERVP